MCNNNNNNNFKSNNIIKNNIFHEGSFSNDLLLTSGIDNRKIIFHELMIKFYVPEDAVNVGTAEVDVHEKNIKYFT